MRSWKDKQAYIVDQNVKEVSKNSGLKSVEDESKVWKHVVLISRYLSNACCFNIKKKQAEIHIRLW